MKKDLKPALTRQSLTFSVTLLLAVVIGGAVVYQANQNANFASNLDPETLFGTSGESENEAEGEFEFLPTAKDKDGKDIVATGTTSKTLVVPSGTDVTIDWRIEGEKEFDAYIIQGDVENPIEKKKVFKVDKTALEFVARAVDNGVAVPDVAARLIVTTEKPKVEFIVDEAKDKDNKDYKATGSGTNKSLKVPKGSTIKVSWKATGVDPAIVVISSDVETEPDTKQNHVVKDIQKNVSLVGRASFEDDKSEVYGRLDITVGSSAELTSFTVDPKSFKSDETIKLEWKIKEKTDGAKFDLQISGPQEKSLTLPEITSRDGLTYVLNPKFNDLLSGAKAGDYTLTLSVNGNPDGKKIAVPVTLKEGDVALNVQVFATSVCIRNVQTAVWCPDAKTPVVPGGGIKHYYLPQLGDQNSQYTFGHGLIDVRAELYQDKPDGLLVCVLKTESDGIVSFDNNKCLGRLKLDTDYWVRFLLPRNTVYYVYDGAGKVRSDSDNAALHGAFRSYPSNEAPVYQRKLATRPAVIGTIRQEGGANPPTPLFDLCVRYGMYTSFTPRPVGRCDRYDAVTYGAFHIYLDAATLPRYNNTVTFFDAIDRGGRKFVGGSVIPVANITALTPTHFKELVVK